MKDGRWRRGTADAVTGRCTCVKGNYLWSVGVHIERVHKLRPLFRLHGTLDGGTGDSLLPEVSLHHQQHLRPL